ncbi:hypothetical protein D3C75_283370 [compost metagenome]
MLVAQVAQALHKSRRGSVETAFALHRFNHNRGDIFRRGVVLKDAMDAGDGVVVADAVQRTGIEGAIDVTRHQPHARRVRGHFPGQRQGVVGAAMIGSGKGDGAVTFGGRAGDFHRVLHRFGAGGHQQGLFREIARHFLVQDLAKLQIGLVGQHLEAGMRQFFQLLFYCTNHLRVQMSGVEHRDAPGKIEILPAFHIPHPAVLRPGGKDRVNLSHAARDGIAATLH